MGQDVFIIQYLFYQYFNFVVVGFVVEQMCWDYLGVVKYQQIVGIEFIEDVGEGVMCQCVCWFVQGE